MDQQYQVFVNGVQVRAESMFDVPAAGTYMDDAYGRVVAFTAAISNALEAVDAQAVITAVITVTDSFDGTPVAKTCTYAWEAASGVLREN